MRLLSIFYVLIGVSNLYSHVVYFAKSVIKYMSYCIAYYMYMYFLQTWALGYNLSGWQDEDEMNLDLTKSLWCNKFTCLIGKLLVVSVFSIGM